MRAGVLAAAVLLLIGGCSRTGEQAAAPVGSAEATATVDSADVAFGDDLTLTIDVRADPALEIELPRTVELAGFRVVDTGATRSESGGVLDERRWLRLRAERAGRQTLPAFEVRYRQAPTAGSSASRAESPWTTISTEPIEIEVRSLLTASDQPAEIREIKPLQPIRRAHPWWWIAGAIAVVVAVAAGLAWWLRRRRARTEVLPEAPPIPAHEVALAALDRLAESEPIGDAAVRRFYFALSEIVRAYVEGRFGLNATDLTSEEILASLHRLKLSSTHAAGLREFLTDTDRVKFAAHRPQRAEIAALLEWSRRFVEETRPAEPGSIDADAAAQEAA